MRIEKEFVSRYCIHKNERYFNMKKIKYANLFVEKYTNDYLLLDFITEEEFIFFRNNGDYLESMRLNNYSPSMLLFNKVKNLVVSEGDILTIPMQELISHKKSPSFNFFQRNREEEQFNGIFMVFNNSEWLENLLSSKMAYKNNRLRNRLIKYVDGTWNDGTPCALNKLEDDIYVEIVDVGQGNTNLIYDKNNLSIFDFGASVYASEAVLKSIISDIQIRFDDFYNASLIISHWDYDHYNLLTAIDEQILENFCCIFIPSAVISLTAKQIVNKLMKNCRFIRTFLSPTPKNKREIGIVPVITENKYTLYVGERSKDKNKSGLMLAIKGCEDITVLGADHTNRHILSCINSFVGSNEKYDKLNIVVPHHGGHCGKAKIKVPSLFIPGTAAVSVGKNSYKHPNQSTIDEYTNNGFEVLRTDWERKNIKIEMK